MTANEWGVSEQSLGQLLIFLPDRVLDDCFGVFAPVP
jgi:hypothetical protein